MEIINVRLTAKVRSEKIPMKKMLMGSTDASTALIGMNDCYLDNKCSATPVFDGLKLEAGNIIRGNAIIQEPTATTAITARSPGR